MNPKRTAALALAMLFMTAPASADKPEWAGGGKGMKEKRQETHGAGASTYFGAQHRRIIAEYYGGRPRTDRKCPSGLAKKDNGCMPPGQAKKWSLGRPLPGDLRHYDLPRDLLKRLPPAPAGHRYVRVDADILLIAVGSRMVLDAVEDLVR